MAAVFDGSCDGSHDLRSPSGSPLIAVHELALSARDEEVAAPRDVTFHYETHACGRTYATFMRNGKVVGSAHVREFLHSIQISDFQIVRGNRRRGIGTAFQAYIEARLGKRAVPDAVLSNAEYRRWKKLDPVAVRDYVKGTKSYTPRKGSDAYFAALGGPPVPGSRASRGFAAQDGARRVVSPVPKERVTPKAGGKRRVKAPSKDDRFRPHSEENSGPDQC